MGKKEQAELKAKLKAKQADKAKPAVKVKQLGAGKAAKPKGKTFKEAEGLPGNKHNKELAKAKSEKAKVVVPQKDFYIQNGKKVLRCVVTPTTSCQIYVGNAEKHRDGLAGFIKRWKAEGKWKGGMDEDSYKDYVDELRSELTGKPAGDRAGKAGPLSLVALKKQQVEERGKTDKGDDLDHNVDEDEDIAEDEPEADDE